ncbi:MAG: FdhF/YdeP family oxidoreductase [Candidatus Sericytochromatia bacterium]|nr:FdhF/YdeP family oxidoreductase [Candidatus Sericytochromatia bacterium]
MTPESPDHSPGCGRDVSVEPPLETRGPRIGPPSLGAGGTGAILSTMKHAIGEMGLVRSLQTLAQVNQKDGFDCPGCAWPDPDRERSVTEFCENGAKAVADEATLTRTTPAFFRQWSVKALSERSDHWLGKQGRLTEPMVLRPGADHYEPISWDDAFALVGQELNALTSPNEALFYTSGRTSNEAAFLYQLFVRLYGTNNLPDCSNMCHESSGSGLGETIGVGKGTVSLDDFELADAIFVIGQNPGTNHPRMLSALQEAARRGCEIVHINPLPEAGLQRFTHPQEVFSLLGKGTALASLFLQVRINGDVALLKGIMKAMLTTEEAAPGTVFDHAFIGEHTLGYADLVADLHAADWDALIAESGISRDEIEAAARIMCESPRVIACWAMGLTQHKNGVANIREVVNLLLLRGHMGKPGAGACPVRGHSNVQGDRTMGIYEKPSPAFLDRLGKAVGFTPPQAHGHDTVAAIRAMAEGRAHVFIGMGGNFLSATPDTAYTAKALQKCRLTVQVSTKLNRGHLVTGETALILPCLGRTETDEQVAGPQFVTVENSMSVVHSSVGKLVPASPHLKSEPAIVVGLAKATLGNTGPVDWDHMIANYDHVRDLIEQVVPGFDGYNRRVRQLGGFYLPNPPKERRFPTASGKAHFTVNPIPRHDLAPGQFLMMTMRSHDQYNTTIYGLDDRYRGVYNGRRVVFLHPADITDAGLQDGGWVDLVSHFQGERRTAHQFRIVAYSIPRRCAATYFPETNVLVPIGSFADRSQTPTSKSVVITLEPTQGPKG